MQLQLRALRDARSTLIPPDNIIIVNNTIDSSKARKGSLESSVVLAIHNRIREVSTHNIPQPKSVPSLDKPKHLIGRKFVTYFIEDGKYYTDIGVFDIPSKYQEYYLHPLGRGEPPNQRIVEGYFKAAGNIKGPNALGGISSTSLYTVDEAYSESLIQHHQLLQHYEEKMKDYRKAVEEHDNRWRGQHKGLVRLNEETKSYTEDRFDKICRILLGNDEFDKAIEHAKISSRELFQIKSSSPKPDLRLK